MNTQEKKREYNRRVYLKKIGGEPKRTSKLSFMDNDIITYLNSKKEEEQKIETEQKEIKSLVKIYKILSNFFIEHEPLSENIKSGLLKINV